MAFPQCRKRLHVLALRRHRGEKRVYDFPRAPGIVFGDFGEGVHTTDSALLPSLPKLQIRLLDLFPIAGPFSDWPSHEDGREVG